jgi:hypothetical protein
MLYMPVLLTFNLRIIDNSEKFKFLFFTELRVYNNEYTNVYNSPYDKESLYYRTIFEKLYPGCEKTIPYFWRHPFCEEKDPSARLLQCYKVEE